MRPHKGSTWEFCDGTTHTQTLCLSYINHYIEWYYRLTIVLTERPRELNRLLSCRIKFLHLHFTQCHIYWCHIGHLLGSIVSFTTMIDWSSNYIDFTFQDPSRNSNLVRPQSHCVILNPHIPSIDSHTKIWNDILHRHTHERESLRFVEWWMMI